MGKVRRETGYKMLFPLVKRGLGESWYYITSHKSKREKKKISTKSYFIKLEEQSIGIKII